MFPSIYGIAGASAGWTPRQPTTDGGQLPVLWLKADAGLWQDTGKTTPASSEDAPIGNWEDQSASGEDFTQPIADQKALLKLNVQNGLPAIFFDGINDALTNVLGAALSQPFDIYFSGALHADQVDDNTDRIFISSDDASNFIILYKRGDSGQADFWRMFGDGKFIAGSAADDEWNVWEAIYNGAASELNINGVNEASGDAGTDNPDGFVLGRLFTNPTANPLKGHMGELLIYDPGLSTTDREQVREYMLSRWRNNHGGDSFVVDADSLHDNVYSNDLGGYLQSNPFARWVFTTSSTSMRVNAFSSIYNMMPQHAEIGVFVDGSLHSTLEAEKPGSNSWDVALPAGNKTVELVAGLTSKPAGTLLGTFLRAVYFQGAATEVTPTSPANRVLVYGDSIAVGDAADIAPAEAWPVLLRDTQPVAVEGWGYRSLHDDASSAALIDAFVANISPLAPATIWLAIGTNDYGLEKWSANDFGSAYEALLADLIAEFPLVKIYCQCPLFRSGEGANSFGDTLGNYRTAIQTAVSNIADSDVIYIDASAWLDGDDLADGTHPTTAGHAIVAQQIETVLDS